MRERGPPGPLSRVLGEVTGRKPPAEAGREWVRACLDPFWRPTSGRSSALATTDVFQGLLLIGLLILVGKAIRTRVRVLQTLFIPSSVVAGALALAVGPEVLGRWSGDEGPLADGAFGEDVLEAWSALPTLLISVVFAALFLGKRIPSPREIWRRAGPQVAFGQTLAWGQYVVGLSLALFVLSPLFGIDPLAGTLIEIGFEGGHGTAAGLSDTFDAVGFAEGADLALGLATFGIITGVLAGTVLINIAARRGEIDPDDPGPPATSGDDPDGGHDERERLADFDEREGAPSTATIDPLSVHVGLVALAVGLGWVLLEALRWIEAATWGGDDGIELLATVPLFPLAMIGGVAVQLVIDRVDRPQLVDRQLMNRISGFAMDVIIVAALATLSLDVLGANWEVFAILAVSGTAWNVGAFIVLAPRFIPEDWFPRASGDFGQSMGMTVTGLLLMRMADPPNRSGALEAFGYKQLMFEPVVGGGLFTAASLPLVAEFGAGPVLAACASLLAVWVTIGLTAFRRRPSAVSS